MFPPVADTITLNSTYSVQEKKVKNLWVNIDTREIVDVEINASIQPPSLNEYSQILIEAGNDPEFVNKYIEGLSQSSLYHDSQNQ